MSVVRPPRRRRVEPGARIRGPRKFHPPEEASQPPYGDDGLWPGPDRPTGPEGSHVQWPFYILLVVPWLTLVAAFLLEHFDVCLICFSNSVPIPGAGIP